MWFDVGIYKQTTIQIELYQIHKLQILFVNKLITANSIFPTK